MYRTGIVSLPLHGGRAPSWLTSRMLKLAKEIVAIIIDEYGTGFFLKRISDPYWFQALGCVLGYDWHSSGVTTVVTGVLRKVLSPMEYGLAVCGGKGKTSRKAPTEISEIGEKFGFPESCVDDLVYTSKMTAKVDNTAIQAGYRLYHHAFFLANDGKWAVVQQGLSSEDRTARRYHWFSDSVQSLIVEPHSAIVGDIRRLRVLDMTSKTSEGARKASVEIAKEPTAKIMRLLESTRMSKQKSLQEWLPEAKFDHWQLPLESYTMPRNIKWDILKRVYEFQPSNYEELLSIKGVGPATVRGLALVAELVYGEKPCWEDPVKFSFAYGGKDGVPFPVNRRAMDESIQVLREGVQAARIGNKEKLRSLQRLRRFIPDKAKS
jgi:hypothetical protein